MLVKYDDLPMATKAAVKRTYVHWHYNTTVATFYEWAKQHAFYVTKDGKLDGRYRHCEPAFMVDTE